MATANVALNVTGNATQQLQRVQKQVDNLGRSFGTLRNALGGIAFGAFFANVLRSADAMDDLAKATGLSIATITGFGDAVKASGGDVQDAAGILGRFSQSLEEGRDGALKAEYQFGKLGLSVAELRNLSDEDVLRKTIEGLAKLPAGAERTALAMEILGKQARFLDFSNLNQSIDLFINNAKKAEPGTKALADLMGNLEGIGRSFRQQLIANGAGVADTLVKLTQNTDAIAKALINLIQVIGAFGAALALLSLPGRIKEFGDFLQVMKKGEGIFATAARGLNNLKTAIQQIIFVLTLGKVATKNWTGGLLVLGDAFSNIVRFVGRFGGVLAVFAAINLVIEKLTGGVNILGTALKVIRDIAVISAAGWKLAFEQLYALAKPIIDLFQIGFVKAAQVLKAAFGPAIDFISEKLKRFAEIYRATVRDAEKVLGLGEQGPVVSRTEGEGAAQKMPFDFATERQRRADAAKAEATELEKLAQGIRATTDAFVKQKDAQLVALQIGASYTKMSDEQRQVIDAQRGIYDDFNNKIEEYKNKISELPPEQEKLKGTYLAQIALLEKLRDEQMLKARDAILATQQEINAQQDLQAELEKTFQKNRALTALDDLRAELDLLGLSGDELERQQRLLDTQRTMRDSVTDAVEKLVKLEEDYAAGTISPEKYNREKSALEATLETARMVAEEKLKIDEEYFERKAAVESEYAKGAKKAMQDIAEQFKPINMAQEAVQKTWGHISDAVDTFVETGKFKFSDFARSILADLAKMIAKAMIFKAISGIAGAFGLSIPGLAKGGPAKGGQPYIVGEKGPELFVPQGSGTVVPNNRLQGTQNGVATGAVNAPVTNNYNTYNINALDAKSVAQLFAENRKAIFGANKMAEREMSYAGAR